MMILDLNQVMISNLFRMIENRNSIQIDKNVLRHMILNSIRAIKVKFFNEFGELVIACDDKNYWRKQSFPYYKANRKKNRDKSDLNWSEIYEYLGEIKQELKEYFHYRVISIENAEADDIIGTLIMEYGELINDWSFGQPEAEKILIVSGDKDFIQLHKYQNVKQYDHVNKRYITHDNPDMFIKEHILKGDVSDGIPNFLSNDNCFVIGERQKSLTFKKIEHYLSISPDEYEDERLKRNYYRNAYLIDLTYIPEEIKGRVIEEYKSEAGKTKTKLFNYFVKKRLNILMEHINEF
jgi:hypothetical protein